ncbi:MAG: hypothetical protein ACREC0_07400 [Methylocella sp.]
MADLGAGKNDRFQKDKWIIDLYEKAMASANDGDRQDALAYRGFRLASHAAALPIPSQVSFQMIV